MRRGDRRSIQRVCCLSLRRRKPVRSLSSSATAGDGGSSDSTTFYWVSRLPADSSGGTRQRLWLLDARLHGVNSAGGACRRTYRAASEGQSPIYAYMTHPIICTDHPLYSFNSKDSHRTFFILARIFHNSLERS